MDGDGDGSSSSEGSSTTADELTQPTDLYFTEEEDALYRLYVRTRRRRRRRRRTTRRRMRVQLNPNMEVDDVFRAVPASSVAIACLPKTTVGDGDGDGDGEARGSGQCGVCLDDYEAGDVLRTMPCSLGFHEHCIVEWLRASRLCPLCRFKLLPPEEDTETETDDDEDDESDAGDDDEDDETETGHHHHDGDVDSAWRICNSCST